MRFALLLTSAALTAAIPASAAQDPDRDIVATAEAAGGFSTLLSVLRSTGLDDALRGPGPFTVFAPTDEAFGALPVGARNRLLEPASADLLATVLRYHVVAGSVSATQALSKGSAATLAGDRLTIGLQRGVLRVAGAKVLKNDIAATNGTIHVIDSVLVPPGVLEKLNAPTPLQVVQLAIERGVPLFNAGQQEACAAIYEVAALSLLTGTEPKLSNAAQRALRASLSNGDPDPVERAWDLRRALDLAWGELEQDVPGVAEASAKRQVRGTLVDDFDEASSEKWQIVNDTVMGGRSRSAVESDGEVGVFAGNVSLENNGGFASARRRVADGSFEGFDGLVVRVRGDGKRYRFSVSDRSRVTADLYQSTIETTAGEWVELRLPFRAMKRNVMGYTPPNSPSIDPARIRGIGVSIGDEQEGPFRLEIDAIGLYRSGRS